jgi:hypothetical protein
MPTVALGNNQHRELKMNRSEKAHQTRVFAAARDLANRICQLPSDVDENQVLAAMKAQKCSKRVLFDAFTVMDNEPHRFSHHEAWHPRLRRLRNNTETGAQLSALFN